MIGTSTPAPAERVAELERRIGHSLPSAYRAWLAENDGGYVNDDGDECVRAILSVGPDGPDSVWNNLGQYDDRPGEPEGTWEPRVAALRPLVTVANDDGGNDFVMPLTGEYAGTVWFIHHECETDGDILYPVEVEQKAESWTEFLALLEVSES